MNFIADFSENKDEIQIVFADHKIRALRYYSECVREDIIGAVEAEVEEPTETLGVYRLKSVEIYNENDEHIHDDGEIIDNQEFHCKEEIEEFLAERYDISKDLITIDGDI